MQKSGSVLEKFWVGTDLVENRLPFGTSAIHCDTRPCHPWYRAKLN